MATLDFPTSPALNEVYSANGKSWTWNGTSWIVTASVTGNVYFNNNTITTSGTNESLILSPNGSGTVSVTSAFSDSAGNIRDLVNSDKTTAYVLVAGDNGKLINITTGGVTVNENIFSAGNNVSIYNNSSSAQTITQGANVTMYLAGTATTGNRTLSQRGVATVICVAANTFVISGAGLF